MKILIIRSAPIKRYKKVIDELCVNNEDALDISVLTHCASNADILSIKPVTIFNYSARKINSFTVGWRTMKKIRAQHFDKIIILGINHLGDGYGSIKILAFLLGAKCIEFWNVKGDKTAVVARTFFKDAIVWYLSMFVYVIIWFGLYVKHYFVKVSNARRD